MCGNQSVRCSECGRKLLHKQLASHECDRGGSAAAAGVFCPLCVAQERIGSEREFVAHLEQRHSAEAKQVFFQSLLFRV